MNKEKKELITDLLQNKGLYSKIKDISAQDFQNLQIGGIENINSLDLFCYKCNAEKTFVLSDYESDRLLGAAEKIEGNTCIHFNNNLCVGYKCPTCDMRLCICLAYNDNCIIKYGQYPSLKDLSRNDINKIKKFKLISDEYLQELNKSEICACESYYVAALLYLRRVFENLVSNLYSENEVEIGINKEEFNAKHLSEKIDYLKPYLAIDEELYSHLYKLLSEGIHSLSEEECEKKYHLLKSLLLDILEEQEYKKKKLENRKAIHQLISQNNGGANDEK